MLKIADVCKMTHELIQKRFPDTSTNYYSAYYMVQKASRQRTFISTLTRTAGKTSFHILNNMLLYKHFNKQYCIIVRNIAELESYSEVYRDICDIYGFREELSTKIVVKDALYSIIYNNNIIAYICTLKKTTLLKKYSSVFRDVNCILMDEYQPEDNTFIKDEVSKMDSIITTISRGRSMQVRNDVYLFLLGNPYTLMNPYLISLGIHKKYKKGVNYIKDEKYIAEFKINENAVKELTASTLATTFGDGKYKTGLEFMIDDYIYIQKIPKNSTYLFTLSFSGNKFGVRDNNSILHISEKYDPSCKKIVSVTEYGRSSLDRIISTMDVEYKLIKECYKLGRLRFDTLKTKNIIYDMFGIDITPR